MQALARLLLAQGWRLSGSDTAATVPRWFASMGLVVHQSHAASNLPADCDLLVYSDAVPADNVERQAAQRRSLPQLSYAELLGQLMAEREGIAIAGTHGKSTTTALVACVLEAAGVDPTVVVGAAGLDGWPYAKAGNGPHFLAEACEYRANFLKLSPRVAAVLSVEPDHFDCYPTTSALEAAFSEFIERLPLDGTLITSADCSTARRLAARARCPVETFGLAASADWQANNLQHVPSQNVGDLRLLNEPGQRSASQQNAGCYRFELSYRGRILGVAALRVPGRHQVANALAAAAVATAIGATTAIGISEAAIIEGLGRFSGLQRRLQMLGEAAGLTFLDDYAHHPTEIAATLATVREMYPTRRIWALFEPHQASRTTRLLAEFAQSLTAADFVAVADIYRARERGPVAGEATAEDLARETASLGVDVLPERRLTDILEALRAAARPGDIVVALGAGDIGNVVHGFVDRLRETDAAV